MKKEESQFQPDRYLKIQSFMSDSLPTCDYISLNRCLFENIVPRTKSSFAYTSIEH
uniref:Uncharacterized protein n=1 Tax=Arundo donax TaxID=35708 RepID=A0A0A9C3Y3_ARUDO